MYVPVSDVPLLPVAGCAMPLQGRQRRTKHEAVRGEEVTKHCKKPYGDVASVCQGSRNRARDPRHRGTHDASVHGEISRSQAGRMSARWAWARATGSAARTSSARSTRAPRSSSGAHVAAQTSGRGLREVAGRTRASNDRDPDVLASCVGDALVRRPGPPRALGRTYVDILCLAWWNSLPPDRLIDRALELQAKGKVRQLMVSCHERSVFASSIADGRFDALMVRYNAAHPGPEREVFPAPRASAPASPVVSSHSPQRAGARCSILSSPRRRPSLCRRRAIVTASRSPTRTSTSVSRALATEPSSTRPSKPSHVDPWMPTSSRGCAVWGATFERRHRLSLAAG